MDQSSAFDSQIASEFSGEDQFVKSLPSYREFSDSRSDSVRSRGILLVNKLYVAPLVCSVKECLKLWTKFNSTLREIAQQELPSPVFDQSDRPAAIAKPLTYHTTLALAKAKQVGAQGILLVEIGGVKDQFSAGRLSIISLDGLPVWAEDFGPKGRGENDNLLDIRSGHSPLAFRFSPTEMNFADSIRSSLRRYSDLRTSTFKSAGR
ncbi:MAG TPA: hypothetical protein PKD37_07175 [Oligoflexia bacterium]|nr:hypothetical protein [Oligoflexia bacterium]HMP27744.1 hypothetical protein [Oligoflexia bacterium]